ncbi:MAG: hypothetical protein IE921_14605, partial [Rhodobacteraceae bacterium]|nr:hypothetical protein [Paracoccaceae bacterium]
MANSGNSAQAHRAAKRSMRYRWLLQASAIAGAAMVGTLDSGPVLAQSTPLVAPRINGGAAVQANEQFIQGSGSVTRGATKDQVQINTPTAIINWTTLDTATVDTTTDYVNFLPAGTEMEFVGTGSDYTVLNRIFSTPNGSGQYRGIAFGGTVTSRLSAAGPIGGNVWFYSPGGILVTAGGVFNVGSLVLTTSDLSSIDDGGATMNFGGVTNPGSSVIIDAGASINALNEGSYVAVFAPRVEQRGTVTTNGSTAYVGAETGQLKIDNGLFDISIGVGTADANGVSHTGTTTGPAAKAVAGPGGFSNPDSQAIYLVAVPKNNAITMLVGGSIGYQAADSASLTSNGQIVLSSGAGVQSTSGFTSPTVTLDPDSGNAVAGGNIDVGSATFTSDTKA